MLFQDVGAKNGKNYSVNIPLHDGIDDKSFGHLFKTIVPMIIARFAPSAIVLQSGADSLAGDPLGSFNLTIEGHAACLELLKRYNLPLMILGGGGYNPVNVARCWTYETAVAIGVQKELDNEIPLNMFYNEYAPNFKLHFPASTRKTNKNLPGDLEKIITTVLANLQELPHAPSVQMFDCPSNVFDNNEDKEEEDNDYPFHLLGKAEEIQQSSEEESISKVKEEMKREIEEEVAPVSFHRHSKRRRKEARVCLCTHH